MKFRENQKYSYLDLSNCIRVLTADSVERARSGHPGMPLGMADVMTILVFHYLKYNPQDPKWFNRDRLVLSNGHGSMLLYAFYYLGGYIDFHLTDIKNFRQLHSKTPGHPEFGAYPAIETTTGPLGQGLANSVGMAIAEKKLKQKLGHKICNYKIYCIVGDGCLMEGIGYEAASLAGHLQLNNLIVLFDDNKISIDGNTNLTISEDHIKKFQAMGWNVDLIDGHDFNQINEALNKAQSSSKPSFIACQTTIAKGAGSKAGSEEAHGAPLGAEEIKLLKQNLKVKDEEFFIDPELLSIWRKAWEINKGLYEEWNEKFNDLNFEQQQYIKSPVIDLNFFKNINIPQKEESTRASSGRIIEELIKNNDKIICGSSDLSISNNVKNKLSKIISKDDFSGNFMHYGAREHSMAAIMNGLSVSGFLPIGGTFFVFIDYLRPAIRLSAIMQRQVIYIMTHDSIGVGEDGPTHQPVEHLAGLRAMPNILVLRPADFVETLECWKIALSHKNKPSVLILTRQNVRQLRTIQEENLCNKGAYILQESLLKENTEKKFNIAIFATGSELAIAAKVAKMMEKKNLSIKVVSLPCFELFFNQDKEYIEKMLDSADLKIGIEAGSSFGWHRIIGEKGLFFGVDQFGLSAPANEVYEYFGLTPENIAKKTLEHFYKFYIK